MSGRLRLLIVGGYGTFGSRIVGLLKDEPRLDLIVAGRSVAKAEAFCAAERPAAAALQPAAFDRSRGDPAALAALTPDLVVDASGPFQAYGAAPYRLIEACLAAGIHYMDLADGSDFVAGVAGYDAAAKTSGIHVLTGASSFPVLTAAVVRRLAVDMAAVEAIRGGIAPSPYAGVGGNVIQAITGYAGQPTPVRRDSADVTAWPLTDGIRYTIAPPGRVPLGSRLFALVEVPDLRALRELWPEARTIWMGAAPVPASLYRLLMGGAWLVRLGLLPTLTPAAPLVTFGMRHLRWGEHRGGMFVEVTGRAASGAALKRSWHLIAEGDHGPFIPAMAVAALVRRHLDGRPPPSGARAAIRDVELDDYERLFRERPIATGIRDDAVSADGQPLYRQALGPAWDNLPPELKAMHDVSGRRVAAGRARVERGPGLLARLAARLVGFPPAGDDVAVTVTFAAADGRETWTRRFGERSFSSVQSAGRGRDEHLLWERFGPLAVAMAPVADNEQLKLVVRRWSLLGVPLPLWLGPRADARETATDGRFHFDVSLAHPLAGLVVRYRGWLVMER